MSEPTKLESMVTLAHKFAGDIMIGTDKELMAMFVIDRAGDVEVIGVPFRDDEEKRVMIINVALEIVEKGADAWSFVTESWFAHRTKGEPLGPRPAEDPKRLEGVICLVSDGQTTQLHSWQTHRDEQGKCTALVEQNEGPKDFSSWIATALNRAKVLHDSLDAGESIREAVEAMKKTKT